MTYLDWGCDTLEGECESCLDALCKVCIEEFREKSRRTGIPDSADEPDRDAVFPDCDNCDLEKKPDCSRCEIILKVCRDCGRNTACEFRICGPD